MRFSVYFGVVMVFGAMTLVPANRVRADEPDVALLDEKISSVGITLNPWGANLGFAAEISGDDPRVQALVRVLRNADLGRGHKCANIGALRFRMSDGSTVGVGLLPGHTEDSFEFRLYFGEEYLAVYRVDRETMLGALNNLGVPLEDPSFTISP
jgi:hypothetical protein